MTVVKIDTSTNVFEQPPMKVMPPQQATLELANDLKAEKAKKVGSENQVVKAELRVVDDGEFKGMPVWDTFVISKTTLWKLAQFAVSTGTYSQEEIQGSGEIDLERIPKGSVCKALLGVRTQMNPSTGEEQTKNFVKRYLFDVQKAQ